MLIAAIMVFIIFMIAYTLVNDNGLAYRINSSNAQMVQEILDMLLYVVLGVAIFLTLGLAEALWLMWHILRRHMAYGPLAVYIVIAEVLGAALWLRATWLVVGVWDRSIRDYSTLYRS